MKTEEVLKFVNQKVFESRGSWLSNIETFIVKGIWDGLSYKEMAKSPDSPYTLNYLRTSAAPKFCGLLSDVFEEKVNKSNLRAVVERHVTGAKSVMNNNTESPLPQLQIIPAEPGVRAVYRDQHRAPDDPPFFVGERIIAWAFGPSYTTRKEGSADVDVYVLSPDGDTNCDGVQYADGEVYLFFEGNWGSLDELNEYMLRREERNKLADEE